MSNLSNHPAPSITPIRPPDQAPERTAARPSTLIQQAVAALNRATSVTLDERTVADERSVWQPGSWFIQRAWETLADSGAGQEALKVAALAQIRHPLATLQALYRVARQVAQRPRLNILVNGELARLEATLFRPILAVEEAQQSERLLLVSATAAFVGNLPLACACLERLDQFQKPWDRVFARAELRAMLAESVARIGLHPLCTSIITSAIRRFDDAGAQFLHETVALIAAQGEAAPQRSRRLLLRCIDTFRYATLTSLHSRRLAAISLGRMGLVDDVLHQLSFIANVQDARRETGLSFKDEPLLIRQVKRPTANADIDFQLYTLNQAIEVMPLRQLSREQRILLADQVAFLGVRSDGWSAAGAATTLIELGAIKYAVEVVHNIAPTDPTRSEGMLSLVRGLLAVDEPELAAEQTEQALAWARARPDRNPERAITWGLAEIYLEYEQPAQALQLLAQWREPTGLRHRIESFWRKPVDDDTLRLRTLRLHALLKQQSINGNVAALQGHPKEVQTLLAEARTWAPRLLEGEALANFLIDDLFRPLLLAGRRSLAWSLLPDLLKVLATTGGSKQATHVAAITTLLAHQLRLAANPVQHENSAASPPAADEPAPDEELQRICQQFLADLWQASAQRGPWPLIHSFEGSLTLLLVLEGSAALVALAQAVDEKSRVWSQ